MGLTLFRASWSRKYRAMMESERKGAVAVFRKM